MKKEDLLKLADLLDRNPMYNCDLWEPHNNLNQAFECLRNMGYSYFEHSHRFTPKVKG